MPGTFIGPYRSWETHSPNAQEQNHFRILVQLSAGITPKQISLGPSLNLIVLPIKSIYYFLCVKLSNQPSGPKSDQSNVLFGSNKHQIAANSEINHSFDKGYTFQVIVSRFNSRQLILTHKHMLRFRIIFMFTTALLQMSGKTAITQSQEIQAPK